MKLLLCPKCSDIVKLGERRKRYCKCKASWGKYIDNLYAEIGGYAISVCLHNDDLVEALRQQPETGTGKELKAWVPARHCRTIKNLGIDIRKEPGMCLSEEKDND